MCVENTYVVIPLWRSEVGLATYVQGWKVRRSNPFFIRGG